MENSKNEGDEENVDTPSSESKDSGESTLSQKEHITQSLEQRNLSPDKNDSSITLEFGDIIELIAPSNEEIHEMTALITYIDNEKIKMI